jgi:hypothetical protein
MKVRSRRQCRNPDKVSSVPVPDLPGFRSISRKPQYGTVNYGPFPGLVGIDRLGLPIEDRGKREANNKLAYVVLDLNGAVFGVFAPGCECAVEVLGSVQSLVVGAHHIGEVEAKLVFAQGLTVAPDVEVKVRHGLSKG